MYDIDLIERRKYFISIVHCMNAYVLTLRLLLSSADDLCKQFRPDETSGLISIQAV